MNRAITPVMRADPLGLWDAPFANMPGLQERASLGTHMMNNGESPEAIAKAMAPPPAKPIATGECRETGTLALGTGVSVAGKLNERSGGSVEVGMPMIAAGARATATCGLKFADPESKSLRTSAGFGFSLGIISVDMSQTSTWPELYIGVGPGIGPEIEVPVTPSVSTTVF